MRKENPLMVLLMVVLALGTAFVLFPSTASAQTDKGRTEKRAEVEDDDDDEDLSDADRRQVKVSIDEARKIALDRVAGTVIDEELEKENGRLQYAFDIRDAEGKIFDVEVSAVTGEILQAEEEDEEDDDAAAMAKMKEKSKKAAKTSSKTVKLLKPKTR